ncbi:MAG: 2-oxoacid:acceptor oxidoreductase family protein [Planctomycetota bacterium]
MHEATEQCRLTPTVAICLSGSGGQGLILAGRLLAEAAALYDGLDVVQTNSYGPEARGGASRSEVVIGRGEIDILHTPTVDALICLTQASCDAYFHHLVPHGLLITDADLVTVLPTSRALEVPMSALARKEVGNVMVANVVALAVLCAVSKIVTREALTAAIKARVPPAHRESNCKAIEVGFAAAESALAQNSPKLRALCPDFSYIRREPTLPHGVRLVARATSQSEPRLELVKTGDSAKQVGQI